jgi:hypothetical protein
MENQQVNNSHQINHITGADVVFFAEKDTSKKKLGGGYINASGFSFRFNVFRNEKFDKGFSIALASHPDPAGGPKWINDVEMKARATSDNLYSIIENKLRETGVVIGRQGYQQAPSGQYTDSSTSFKLAPVEQPRVIGNTPDKKVDDIPW